MTTPAIVVNDLSKRYGNSHGVLALDHVNLSIAGGTVFGLMGPNGAGKTTLIKVLTGISDITSGTASVAGFDVQKQSLQVRARIGWVAAEVILEDDFTTWENLWLQARLQDIKGWEERAEQLLQYFGLLDRKDDKVSHYSTGMRKKLEIALALLHQPTVIFMDEPTIGLDVATVGCSGTSSRASTRSSASRSSSRPTTSRRRTRSATGSRSSTGAASWRKGPPPSSRPG